ncbi:polysaccharide deacetylase family protein [Nonomuraea sp. MG754425]|uniref:polysaccharide deacetylase family protein n=1 Tax=Nonomuraea sp. MG754425 TaxID=2570319 RepID=UPI002351AEE5|nr:polysaccharide deacetylase family protein [Nonomuraea sp. MG754425]
MHIGAIRGTARLITALAMVTAACGAGHRAATADHSTTDHSTTGHTTTDHSATGPAAAGAAIAGPAAEGPAATGPAVTRRSRRSAADAKPIDCRRVKCVALTFDDGPGVYTDELLRHLAAYRARATFFVIGQNVAAHPEVLRRTYEAGHEIGGHTWSHPDLTKLTAAAVRAQFARTDQAVKAAIGVTPKLIRPPYGALSASVRRQTRRPMVLWSVDTLDWLHRDSARVARKAVRSVRPGSIVLFHDIHPTTVAAIPQVLKLLSARGYRFVTVSRLFGGEPPRLVYSRARG